MPGAGEEFDDQYYQNNGQADDRPALRWYAQLARRYLGRGPALDVGCGTGHLLRRLAAQGPADGLEVSAYSAQLARQNSPGSKLYLSPAELPDHRYDRFVGIHVIEHLTDEQLGELFAELRRAARPGARYLFVTPDAGGAALALHGAAWGAYGDPTHINLKTHQQWRDFLSQQGFTVLRSGSDGLWNFPYSSLPRVLDAARYGLPMATQFVSGRLFLPPGSGESCLLVLS